MSDLFTEVLQNYLNDEEWKQNVEIFVSANCLAFENIRDHTHGEALLKIFDVTLFLPFYRQMMAADSTLNSSTQTNLML